MFDFPSSPSINDIYTSSGVSFRYNGVGWTTIGDGPYLPLVGGTLTGNLVLSTGATAPMINLKNTLTGTTASDGFEVSVDNNNRTVYLWNYENAPISFGTNNTERMVISATGAVRLQILEVGNAGDGSAISIIKNIAGGAVQLNLVNEASGAGVTATYKLTTGGLSSTKSIAWYIDDTNAASIFYAAAGLTSQQDYFSSTGHWFKVSNNGDIQNTGHILPSANNNKNIGSASLRWATVYTADLSLNNGIGDWTLVEGEDDLFLYNNKKGKTYKFSLVEVDQAPPKRS